MKQSETIYLASKSPRRSDILTLMGLKFEVADSLADEKTGRMKPAELVELLSLRKAEQALVPKRRCVVIGSDTVVAFRGKVLGKPKDKADAKRMLRLLSGKKSAVYTGVTVQIRGKDARTVTFHTKTEVLFDELTDAEIDEYIATGDPMDKAGAYGIQGVFGRHISGIRGDYYNVMGLPMNDLYKTLIKEKVIFI
ncbi:MAG: septum formation protein Maf [Lachnospiraceae bacterium]|nr:septum formation protein Maf [Lachnospiraceae bacterium]